MQKEIPNSQEPFWLENTKNGKFALVLPMNGTRLELSDFYKLALQQDTQENGDVVFSLQKFSRQTFESHTTIKLQEPCRWICLRVFVKENGQFIPSEFEENEDKVKVRLVKLDSSVGRDFMINENPLKEETN